MGPRRRRCVQQSCSRFLNRFATRDELREVGFYVYPVLAWVLEDGEVFDGTDIEMYEKSLQYLLDLDGKTPTVEDIGVLKNTYPTAYDELESLAKPHGYSGASPETLCGLQMSRNDGPKVNLVKHVIQDEISYARQVIGLYERRAELDAAITGVKTDRMLNIVQRTDMGLARSHLDNRFYNLYPSSASRKIGSGRIE